MISNSKQLRNVSVGCWEETIVSFLSQNRNDYVLLVLLLLLVYYITSVLQLTYLKVLKVLFWRLSCSGQNVHLKFNRSIYNIKV